MAAKALSAKHQRFVAEYLKDMNATQAYIRAGYAATHADVAGPRLLGNVGVRAAIDAALAKRAGKLEITAEKVLRDLEEVRERALAAEQFAPAVRAIELCGKHVGMFVDRSESNVTLNNAIDRPPQETRDEWLARRQKELAGGAMGTPAGTAD